MLGVAWCCLGACGPSEEPPSSEVFKRVIPVVPLGESFPSSVLLDDREERFLGKVGDRHVWTLPTVGEQLLIVEIQYEGGQPALFDLGDGSETPVRLRALPSATGVGRDLVNWRPDISRPRLALEFKNESVAVKRLIVRTRADRKGPAVALGIDPGAPDAERPFMVTVSNDQRRGWLIEAGVELSWDVTFPQEARGLRFEISSDPRPFGKVSGFVPLEVVVEAEAPSLGRVLLGRVTLEDDGHRWRVVRLDTREVAGQQVRLSIGCEVSSGRGGKKRRPPPLALSVPEIFCEEGAARPNVVLLSIDTLRADHVGVYGYDRGTTPRLDSLANRGVVFQRAQSAAPYTLPSHATLLSGQWPTVHGAIHPTRAIDPASTPLLASLLSREGWATRAFTGGGYLNADFGFAYGFSGYSQFDPIWSFDQVDVVRALESRQGKRVQESVQAQSWERALSWIDEHREVPWFLFLQTFVVHDYRGPEEAQRRFTGGRVPDVAVLRTLEDQLAEPYTASEIRDMVDLYDAALSFADSYLGDLLDHLETQGLSERTIVVVTSDHGEAFGERHGLVGHGRSVHEEMLSVPLVLAGPGIQPGHIAERVSHVDLAPTLLDLLDVARPDAMQGRSLLPLLEGDRSAPSLLSEAWAEVGSNVTASRSLTVGKWKIIEGDTDALVEYPASDSLLLYDLSVDPLETHNRVPDRPVGTEEMVTRLRLFQASLEASRKGEALPVELSPETLEQLRELGYLK